MKVKPVLALPEGLEVTAIEMISRSDVDASSGQSW